MTDSNKKKALLYLNELIGKQLWYGLKSPDTELFDFGFGEFVEIGYTDVDYDECKYAIHALCKFKIVYKKEKFRVARYYYGTTYDEFSLQAKTLIGSVVQRIDIGPKNDLLLDFEEFTIVFSTNKDEEESWRFFARDEEKPHLVVTNTEFDFVY